MRLDRVTITGADSAVKLVELAALSRDFPFVEWGVLFSEQRTGSPRYPDWGWVHRLAGLPVALRLSAHLCGRYARQVVLEGDSPWHRDAGVGLAFDRVQLNVSGMATAPSPAAVEGMRQRFGPGELIIQARPERLEIWRAVNAPGEALAGAKDLRPGLLFDSSGGRGQSPAAWPAAEPGAYCGYAGGLGPHNLHSQLQLIERAAGAARVWADMESGVRDDHDAFDLGKARRALEQAAPWVQGPAGAPQG